MQLQHVHNDNERVRRGVFESVLSPHLPMSAGVYYCVAYCYSVSVLHSALPPTTDVGLLSHNASIVEPVILICRHDYRPALAVVRTNSELYRCP